MSTAYTFKSRAMAHTMRRDAMVIVPDQVAQDQHAYDGRTFPVLRCNSLGRPTAKAKARATLMGEEYGLHGPGTGDMVVRMA